MKTDDLILPKEKRHAFGKDVYLLGMDAQGIYYWLEQPKWDCGWYWGFGYIRTYTNNGRPDLSRNINSHEHATKFMAEWFTEWNDSKPRLTVRTFSDKEGWELSELFNQFYFLKDAAEKFKNGKANCGNTTIPKWEKPELVKEINEKLIPIVTARILEILSPNKI